MSVTAELDNFKAVSEFWSFRDTCGECAGLVLEHCKDGLALTGPDVDAVRNQMQAAGFAVQHGTVMSDLVRFFHDHRGLDITYDVPWGSDLSVIHAALLAHAGRDGVLLEVAAAHNLTGNEPGVDSHYVALGGIHPTLGYLVANGDDVNALNAAGGHGKIIPTRWMSWAVVASAQPRAVAIVHGLSHTTEVSGAGPDDAPEFTAQAGSPDPAGELVQTLAGSVVHIP